MQYEVHVQIMLKPTVMDAQGTVIERALHKMGHTEVGHVHLGKYVTMTIDSDSPEKAREIAETMSRELLANLIIEEYHVQVVEKASAA